MSKKSALIIAHLWDYGWLQHECIGLPTSSSDFELIQEYVHSPAFHTSFLPNDKDETGIHGPFCADLITAADYILLDKTDLEHYLQSVTLSESLEDDEIERTKLLKHLRTAFQENTQCYVLRVDERNTELFHDWGWVLLIFREFLFVDLQLQRNRLGRFVIGYD